MTRFSLARCCVPHGKRRNWKREGRKKNGEGEIKRAQLLFWRGGSAAHGSTSNMSSLFRHTLENETSFQTQGGEKWRDLRQRRCLPLRWCPRAWLTTCACVVCARDRSSETDTERLTGQAADFCFLNGWWYFLLHCSNENWWLFKLLADLG